MKKEKEEKEGKVPRLKDGMVINSIGRSTASI